MAIPVCLEGADMDRATVDAARRLLEANRAGSKAGKREWELSRGFLYCGDCGRSMCAVVTRDGKYDTAYHYYACSEPRHARRSAPSRCPNRRSHPAAHLEWRAAGLFEENASYDALSELYERAVRQEEERLGLGDPATARETHERLSGELEALNAERKGYLRLAARGDVPDAELDDLLQETDGKRQDLTERLREAEAAMNARRSASYSYIHREWEQDPDAIRPDQVLTHASSTEDVRAAYRRFGTRFEVGADGELTMRMELPLGDPGGGPPGGDLLGGLTTIRRQSTRGRRRPSTLL